MEPKKNVNRESLEVMKEDFLHMLARDRLSQKIIRASGLAGGHQPLMQMLPQVPALQLSVPH